MKDYKTTIGGIMLAVGAVLAQLAEPAWMANAGTALLAIGGLIAGTQAGDKRK